MAVVGARIWQWLLLFAKTDSFRLYDWNFSVSDSGSFLITKTRLFKYIENFTTEKGKFSDKKFWYFFIFLLKT